MKAKIKLKMTLISDAIFGNGDSIPGEEDISVQFDSNGFPYYKGGTFKGVFREMFIRYLNWTAQDDSKVDILGKEGVEDDSESQVRFSDFRMSPYVMQKVMEETAGNNMKPDRDEIIALLTNTRTFTQIDNGIVSPHSLRIARCVNKGLTFYSEVLCDDKDKELIKEVIGMIKWIGTLKNRGFGSVDIKAEEVSDE